MIGGIERVLIDDDGVLRRMDRFWRVEDVVKPAALHLVPGCDFSNT